MNSASVASVRQSRVDLKDEPMQLHGRGVNEVLLASHLTIQAFGLQDWRLEMFVLLLQIVRTSRKRFAWVVRIVAGGRSLLLSRPKTWRSHGASEKTMTLHQTQRKYDSQTSESTQHHCNVVKKSPRGDSNPQPPDPETSIRISSIGN
jgi:hypothetical protein